ncbi:MAG: hypothetical protein L3J02_01970 [Henriciella sp.]|nr:hypothetical protein [Henriciella sp.]
MPAMRVAPILRAVAAARARLLLALWAICAITFYLIMPAASQIDGLASLSLSIILWAFVIGAACHAVLWAQTPTLTECLSVSAHSILYTSSLVFVTMLASFLGFIFVVIPGLILMVLLSLSVPIMIRERRGLFTCLEMSIKLTILYWGTALIITRIGGGVMIVTTVGALMIAGIVLQGDIASSPLYDALMFSAWAVASGVLGSSRLLAIREVDAGP